nr:E3 ubiquitin-protein ligase TRIM31-like [Cherax quadricarinatus]
MSEQVERWDCAQNVFFATDNGNPEECIVCLTNYDDDLQRPRTVPCGHTFCSQCIETTITTDNNQYFTCPSCRTKHSATTATQFPINYGMEAFIRKHKSMLAKHCQGCPAETHKKIQLLVKEHKSSISNLLVQCDEVLFQLDKYQEQVRDWKTQHHLLEARLYDLLEQNKAAIELLEKENTGLMNVATEGEAGKQQLHTWLECLDTLNTVEEINKTITESDPYRKEAENWIQKCQQLVPDASIFDASKKVKVALREALDMMTMVMGTTVVPIRLGHTSSAIGSQVDRLTAEFSLYKLTIVSKFVRQERPLVESLLSDSFFYAMFLLFKVTSD